MGRKRVGDGGRIQRRVLVDDCRHFKRCKFFVVAYTLHIYDPAREKNRCLLTVRVGESFSIRLATANRIIAYENQI